MGSGASFDAGISNSTQDNHGNGRYFCHSCHRVFGLGGVDSPLDYYCPHCQSTFLEELGNSMFSEYNFGGSLEAERGISVRHRSHGHAHSQLTSEQSRRISNATAMLRLLETQLRDELEHLQRAFQTASNRITAQNSQKTKKLTTVMLSKLRAVTVTLDMICSQPSCPICSEDFVVLPIAPSSSSAVKAAVLLPSSSPSLLSMAKEEEEEEAKATCPRLDAKADLALLDEGKEEGKELGAEEVGKLDAKELDAKEEDEMKKREELDAKEEEKHEDADPPCAAEKSDVALTSQAGDKEASDDLCDEKPLAGEGAAEKDAGGPGPSPPGPVMQGAAAAPPVLLSGRGGPSTMEDDWLTQLPCSHLFHPNCIIPWMEMKQNCPICRYEISDKIFTVEEFTRLFSRYELVKKLQDLDVPVTDDPSLPSDDLAALLQKHLLRCQQSEQEADRLAAEREAERELLQQQQQQMVLSRERRARRLSHSRAEIDLAELSGGSTRSSISRGGSSGQLQQLLDPSDMNSGRFPLSGYGRVVATAGEGVSAATTPRQGHRRAHSMSNAVSHEGMGMGMGMPSNALVVHSNRSSNSSSNSSAAAAARENSLRRSFPIRQEPPAGESALTGPSIASSVASAALVFQSSHRSQSPGNMPYHRGSTRSSFGGHQRRISGTIPEGDAEPAAPSYSSSSSSARHGSSLTQVLAADRAQTRTASLEIMSSTSSVAATDGDTAEVESLLSVPASSVSARLSSSSSAASLAAAAVTVTAASSRDRHGHSHGHNHPGLSHSNSHGSNLSDASTSSPSSLQMFRNYLTFSFPTVYSSSNNNNNNNNNSSSSSSSAAGGAPSGAPTNASSVSPMRRRI